MRRMDCDCLFIRGHVCPDIIFRSSDLHDPKCPIHYFRYAILLKMSHDRVLGPIEVLVVDDWIQGRVRWNRRYSVQLEIWFSLRGRILTSLDLEAFSQLRLSNKEARAVCSGVDDYFGNFWLRFHMPPNHPLINRRKRAIKKHLLQCLYRLHPSTKKIERRLNEAGSLRVILSQSKPQCKCCSCKSRFRSDNLYVLLDCCPHLLCMDCIAIAELQTKRCFECSRKIYGYTSSKCAARYLSRRGLGDRLTTFFVGYTL